MKRKIRMLASLVLTLALAVGLALPAGAVDDTLPTPDADGYVVVTTPEQLAMALSDQSVGKIRLGDDVYAASANVSATYLFQRNLTLDLDGHTWEAKTPEDSAALLGIMEDVSVTILNGYITFGGGDRTVIWQTAGELTLESVTMNGGIDSTGKNLEIRNCTISRDGPGDYGAVAIGDGNDQAASGHMDIIANSTVTSGSVGIWLRNGTIGSIASSVISGEGDCGVRIGGQNTSGTVTEFMQSSVSGKTGVYISAESEIQILNDSTIIGGVINDGVIGTVFLQEESSIDGIYGGKISEGFLIRGTVGTISGCTIVGATDDGRKEPIGINVMENGQVGTVSECSISGSKGAICNAGTMGTIENCADIQGRIIIHGTVDTISGCNVTVENEATDNGSGAISIGTDREDAPNIVGSVGTIRDCVLSGNETIGHGISVINGSVDVIADCTITAAPSWAGVRTTDVIGIIKNCTISGGYSGILVESKGYEVIQKGSIAAIDNCTVNNGVFVQDGQVECIKNCTLRAESNAGNFVGAVVVGTADAENPDVGSIGEITGCTLTGRGSEVTGLSLWNGVVGKIINCKITSTDDAFGIKIGGYNVGTIGELSGSTISGDSGIVQERGSIYTLRDCTIAAKTLAGLYNYGEAGTVTGNVITSEGWHAIVNEGGITRLEDNRLTGNPADGSGVDVYNSAEGTIQTVYAAGTLKDNLFTASSGWTLLNEGTVGEYKTPDQGGSGSGSGGGGSTVPSTDIKENADGSKTETMTDEKTGAVTETTTWPDGSKAVVETRKDGSKTEEITKADGTKAKAETDANGKVEATVALPVTEGKTVLPLSKMPVAKSAGDASLVTIQTGKPVTVVIPVENTGAGTVAILVREDGTEEIIKTSVAGADGLMVALDGTATIKILDNSKDFADMSLENWASDAVDFVTSRELFQGTGANEFSPALPMNRAMLVTVLYRLENEPETETTGFDDVAQDAWYGDAVAWASGSGIVTGTGSGFDPNGLMTRESLAVMLYRYAKPGTTADGNLEGYPDNDNVSGWAAEAMEWAVQSGILSGKGGGGLDPQGQASRAEVATMLMRFIENRNA